MASPPIYCKYKSSQTVKLLAKLGYHGKLMTTDLRAISQLLALMTTSLQLILALTLVAIQVVGKLPKHGSGVLTAAKFRRGTLQLSNAIDLLTGVQFIWCSIMAKELGFGSSWLDRLTQRKFWISLDMNLS